MEIKTPDDELVAIAAFRYALGRRTYIVSAICEFLISQKDNLADWAKRSVVKEIKTAIDESRAGDEVVDVPEWQKVIKAFENEK